MINSVTFSQVQEAAARLDGVARRTPLIENDVLSAIVGKRVLVKLECLQHTGSFKWRGAWNAVKSVAQTAPGTGVIAYSSGNHAQGVARAAKILQCPAVIVMPSDAPAMKIRNTRNFGAEVVLYDRPNNESREAVGEAIAQERGLTLIRPYDDERVIAGQGTCGLEIVQQAKAMGVEKGSVLVCCGGGGLSSGIALAFEGSESELEVIPVEPACADDVCRSLISGQRESVIGVPDTVCDAIITPSPGEITFPILKRLCARGLTVSDDEVKQAVCLAFDQLKVIAEPGGAVALAAAMVHGSHEIGDSLVVVITGGNVDANWFAATLAEVSA